MPALSIRNQIIYLIALSPAIYILTVMWLIPEGDKYAPVVVIFAILAFIVLRGWNHLPQTKGNPRKPYLFLILISTFWYILTYKLNDGNISQLRTLVSVSLYTALVYRFDFPLSAWRASISASCIALSAVCFYQFFALDISRASLHHNPIPFATGLAFFMSVSCALAFREVGRIRFIELFTATLALAAIATTGTRGVLIPSLAIVLIALYWGLKNTEFSNKSKGITASLILISVLAGAFPMIDDRIQHTANELEKLQTGDFSSSIGLRLQFWKGASEMALLHPLTGIGNHHFDEYQKLGERNLVDKKALDYAPHHYHNQFLDDLVKRGVPGLLLLLATLTIPIIVSLKSTARGSWQQRSILLIAIITATASLTDVPLNHPPAIFSFYVLTFCLIPTQRSTRHQLTRRYP